MQKTVDYAARLFELSTDLLSTIDVEGRFVHVNPAWEKTLGWSVDELIGQRAVDFVHPDDLERTLALRPEKSSDGGQVLDFENRYRHKQGGWRWLLWSAHSDGDLWYGVAKDVTERKQLEQRAVEDPLTGLANRSVLTDRLAHALRRLPRSGSRLGVLFVDLDRFKAANDTLGHEVGDALLIAVAHRLKKVVRESDTVARMGGDEFVVLAEEIDDEAEAVLLAERLVETLRRPFTVGGTDVTLRGSVGISTAGPEDHARAERVLSEADLAMYRAKAAGRDRIELFDERMRADVATRLEISGELRHALERSELRLVYQPLVSVSQGVVKGCEALLRWRHPRLGDVPPAKFVPLAAENGLIVPIGEWVLKAACHQGARWRHAGNQVTVGVNVSPVQLSQPGFVDVVGKATREANLPPQCLWLEVVEESVIEDNETIVQTLGDLRELGVRIALDDFGKGATSLSYFRAMPLDVVKLDRAFVQGLSAGVVDRAIVAAIVSLADEMNLSLVAEGIEQEDQLAELRQLGCEYAQGFWFARPTEAENLKLEGFAERARPGLGDPTVIREFMRQIGIPARIA